MPIVLALREWGDQHLRGSVPRAAIEHTTCGHDLRVRTVCAACSTEVDVDEVRATARGTHPPLDVVGDDA